MIQRRQMAITIIALTLVIVAGCGKGSLNELNEAAGGPPAASPSEGAPPVRTDTLPQSPRAPEPPPAPDRTVSVQAEPTTPIPGAAEPTPPPQSETAPPASESTAAAPEAAAPAPSQPSEPPAPPPPAPAPPTPAKGQATAPLLRFSELYAGASVTEGLILSEKVQTLKGNPVTMQGYMAPPLKASFNFFVLTKVPLAICPFCSSDADWPDDIVLVLINTDMEALPYTKPLEVTGHLEVGGQVDPETGFYSLLRIRADSVKVVQ